MAVDIAEFYTFHIDRWLRRRSARATRGAMDGDEMMALQRCTDTYGTMGVALVK